MASSLVWLTVLGFAGVNAAAAADGWWWFNKARADNDGAAAAAGADNNWRPARETVTGSLDPLGWTPKPTSTLMISNIDNSSEKKKKEYALVDLRQNGDDDDDDSDDDDDDGDKEDDGDALPTICATRWGAGGILDPKDATITCGEGSFCTADDRAQRVGCCDTRQAGDCAIPTTCVDLADMRFLRQRADPETMFCADRHAPSCITYSYDGTFGGAYDGYEMFSCSRRPRSIIVQQAASFNYGDITITTITTSTTTGNEITPPSTRPPVTTPRETTDPTVTPAPTSDRETATTGDPSSDLPTGIIGGGGGGDGSSSSSSSDGEESTATAEPNNPSASSSVVPVSLDSGGDSSSMSKTGAIVGGVVGGLGGAALLATAVLFFLYRRRKQNLNGQAASDGSSGPYQNEPLGATYYPGPQDPPLHPQQYGPLSPQQPMGQVSPYFDNNNNYNSNYSNNNNNNMAAPTATNNRAVSSRAPSSFLAAAAVSSLKTADDDAVSPISSRRSSVSLPGSPRSGYVDPVSPANTMAMPPVRYNRFSPPPPEQFQAYRPYPGT